MKKIRIIQIGVGHDHAHDTILSLKRLSDVYEIAGFAVCEDEDGEYERKRKYFADLPKYTPEEILALPDIDAAAIETDDTLLTKYTRLAAERGLHIHMDKPGSACTEDFERMLSVMKKNRLVFQSGYMYRYNPTISDKLRRAKDGEYGRIYAVEAYMDCEHKAKKREWLKSFPGGMLYFLGCHLIDLTISILGLPDEIIPLSAATGIEGVESCDFGMAVLKYGGVPSLIKTSATEPGGFLRRRLLIHGENATLEISPLEKYTDYDPLLLFSEWREAKKESRWSEEIPFHKSEPCNRYDNMMSAFASYVRGIEKCPYSYEYEATLHRVILAAAGENVNYKEKIVL